MLFWQLYGPTARSVGFKERSVGFDNPIRVHVHSLIDKVISNTLP